MYIEAKSNDVYISDLGLELIIRKSGTFFFPSPPPQGDPLTDVVQQYMYIYIHIACLYVLHLLGI